MCHPEVSSRPTDSRSPSVPVLRLRRQLFYYLVVGGLTVVVDIGLLALLHESYGVPLGAATTVAFCTAVVIGPRLPAPIVIPSTERMGETSAAVPVNNS